MDILLRQWRQQSTKCTKHGAVDTTASWSRDTRLSRTTRKIYFTADKEHRDAICHDIIKWLHIIKFHWRTKRTNAMVWRSINATRRRVNPKKKRKNPFFTIENAFAMMRRSHSRHTHTCKLERNVNERRHITEYLDTKRLLLVRASMWRSSHRSPSGQRESHVLYTPYTEATKNGVNVRYSWRFWNTSS